MFGNPGHTNSDVQPDVSPVLIFLLSQSSLQKLKCEKGVSTQLKTHTHAQMHTQTHKDPEWDISAH